MKPSSEFIPYSNPSTNKGQEIRTVKRYRSMVFATNNAIQPYNSECSGHDGLMGPESNEIQYTKDHYLHN